MTSSDKEPMMHIVPNLEKYRFAADRPDAAQWLRDRSRVAESGCREWQLARASNGYGVATVPGQKMQLLAHRLSYWIHVAPIPEGDWTVDHMCKNRGCIEPTHLRLLSRADNTRDGSRATSQTCKRGHPLYGPNLYFYVDPHGKSARCCRTCNAAKAKRANARRTTERRAKAAALLSLIAA